MLDGLLAFVYVAALLYAAPLLRAKGIAGSLRGALIIGIALPALLGAADVLYAPVLWACLAALCVWRSISVKPQLHVRDSWAYATLGACLVVLWPPLSRPLLDGDTLLYHLPNAAAFVQNHSIWTASAPYWLYPQASELFSAGVFAVAGRWSLPIAGALPALLIAARLYEYARASGAPAWVRPAAALAFVCTPVAAFQNGTLQNDVWLAAFVIEVLSGADATWVSAAVCALLKPFGWIDGLIAGLCGGVRLRTLLLALVPLALWAARDAVLLAQGHARGFSVPPYAENAIAPNMAAALPQLLHGIAAVTPQSFVWVALLLCGACVPATRRYALAGGVMLLAYVFLPQSYRNGATNYVLDASSWRYALPALACGALIAAALCKRLGVACAIGGYALAAWGAWNVLAIYWNDAYTHYALLAALLAVAAAAIAGKTRGVSVAVVALAVVLAGWWCASSRALGFYADWMRQPSGKPTGVFTWLADHRPAAIVAANVRGGAVLMASPHTRVVAVETMDGACALAANENALLLIGSNEEPVDANVQRAFAQAKNCGAVLYEDGAGVLVKPRSMR
ncbi:MAG TPA: hypothetical protein VFH72_09085 [Candidatus Baltobacteraceae bacterium]|nr:hypothetical protein [Candidatus Baltobacteraceae bacterium]